jgi:hypothetical protein
MTNLIRSDRLSRTRLQDLRSTTAADCGARGNDAKGNAQLFRCHTRLIFTPMAISTPAMSRGYGKN